MAIFSAIGAAVAGLLFTAGTAAFTLASTLIGGALSFGAKLLTSYLNRPKKRKYTAVQGETQFGGDVPVGTIYGTSKVRGQRIAYFKYGKGNKFNTEVFVLANGWCDGLEPEVYFYGKRHDLVSTAVVGGEAARYVTAEFGNNLSFRFYDGRPGQVADAKLVADTANLGQKWKATSRCTGLTYVIVDREWDERFDKGKPEFDFVLRGLREYDPRKDSTVAGGSGSHRLSDPATWEHTKNPALHRLNYQLGLRGLISGRTLIGEGKTLGQLDLGSYVAAMNVCDTLRSDGKKTYECSLYVSGEDDHTEILKEFDDAMAGYGLNRRGLSGVIPGAPQIPVMEITAADIPIERAQDLQKRKSAFDLFNHIAGQFTSPENNWQPESLKPVRVNADVAADGRPRQTSNDFLQVTDPDLAQYLLTIRYRQNRKAGSANVPVSSRAGLAVQEGEWVTFEGKEWLVTGWQCDERFRFTLTLAETGADIYDDEAIEPGPIVIPPTPPVNPSLLSTVSGFGVQAGMVQGANGYEVPSLRFTWDPPEDPTIVAVRFFYQIEGDATRTFEDQSSEPELGEHITTKDVQPGVVFIARATITTLPDRLKTYTPWETTAVTGNTFYPIDLDQLAGDVTELLDFMRADIDDAIAINAQQQIDIATEIVERVADSAFSSANIREIMVAISESATKILDQDFANFSDKQTVRSELRSEADGARAFATSEVTAATGPGSALAQRIDTLQADAGDLAASIVTVDQARIAGDDALATQISLLSAGSNNQFDYTDIWHFDTTVEGWGGDGAPTAVDGWLRPADHATDPYVVSPAGLAVDVTKYRQVRGRIRKVGSPGAWAGQVRWASEASPAFDDVRMTTIAEPSYDGSGIALVTFNTLWTGDPVDRIKIDLSTLSDGSNYFEFDWLAIGRPSPGASSAELATERTARIDGDGAHAASIEALQATVNDPVGGVVATAGSVSLLTTRVEDTEEGLQLAGEALTALDLEVEGKATLEAVAGLQAQIDDFSTTGAPGLSLLASYVTGIRQEVLPTAMEAVDQDFANFSDKHDIRGIVSSVYQVLDSGIQATKAGVAANAAAITSLNVGLTGKAEGSALNSLTVKVEATEASIAAQAASITSINSALMVRNRTFAQAAAPSATNAGDLWIETDAGNKIYRAAAAGAGSWVALPDQNRNRTFAQPAAPTAESVGDLWIDTDGNNEIKRWNGASWVALADPRPAANASAISSLTTRVEDTEGGITALSDAVTALETTVDGVAANATFRMQTGYTPAAGWTSRIGMEARINSGATFRAAGIYLEATTTLARVVLAADQVVIADGLGAVSALFLAGTTYINNARINDLEAVNIKVGSIDSPSIAIGAVTENEPLNYFFTRTLEGGEAYTDGGLVTKATFVVEKPAGTPAIEFINLRAFADLDGSGAADAYILVYRNGELIGSVRSNNSGTELFSASSFLPTELTSYTYEIKTWNDALAGNSSSATIEVESTSSLFYWKR